MGNLVRYEDPRGDKPWFKNEANEVMWSASQVDEIVDENSTRWQNIGETFMTTDNDGNLIYGDTEGYVNTTLPDVTVSAAYSGVTGMEKADIITNAVGAVADITEGLVDAAGTGSMAIDPSYLNVAKVVKGLGTGLSVIGVGISLVEAYENPTLGNILKVAWNAGVMTTGPVGGVADALFEVSGLKDKMFEGIDTLYQNVQNQPEQEQEQDK